MFASYKIVCLGDGGVGKTALTIQLCLNHFIEAYSYRKHAVIDDQPCLIEILDTAGQEEYTALRDQWIREGEGFLLVYSITDRTTFERIDRFRSQIMRVKDSPRIPIMLVGNKADKINDRVVSKDEGAALAKQLSCEFAETSAKTRAGLEVAFYTVIRRIRDNNEEQNRRTGKKDKPSAKRSETARNSDRTTLIRFERRTHQQASCRPEGLAFADQPRQRGLLHDRSQTAPVRRKSQACVCKKKQTPVRSAAVVNMISPHQPSHGLGGGSGNRREVHYPEAGHGFGSTGLSGDLPFASPKSPLSLSELESVAPSNLSQFVLDMDDINAFVQPFDSKPHRSTSESLVGSPRNGLARIYDPSMSNSPEMPVSALFGHQRGGSFAFKATPKDSDLALSGGSLAPHETSAAASPRSPHSPESQPSTPSSHKLSSGSRGSPAPSTVPTATPTPKSNMVTLKHWDEEDTDVYLIHTGAFTLARRADDDAINGTKLLNVTGITRGKRDGLLKIEPNRRVVKVGLMHYKGVWIALDRAKALAAQHGILDMVYPLFEPDLSTRAVLSSPDATMRPNRSTLKIDTTAGSAALSRSPASPCSHSVPGSSDQSDYSGRSMMSPALHSPHFGMPIWTQAFTPLPSPSLQATAQFAQWSGLADVPYPPASSTLPTMMSVPMTAAHLPYGHLPLASTIYDGMVPPLAHPPPLSATYSGLPSPAYARSIQPHTMQPQQQQQQQQQPQTQTQLQPQSPRRLQQAGSPHRLSFSSSDPALASHAAASRPAPARTQSALTASAPSYPRFDHLSDFGGSLMDPSQRHAVDSLHLALSQHRQRMPSNPAILNQQMAYSVSTSPTGQRKRAFGSERQAYDAMYKVHQQALDNSAEPKRTKPS
ncbi:hypothetical protein E5Q_03379 [Mixia osmundae IAM 14324]|uniref:HTH APSES-type domain-containing protein n=1 Tax=Mixia osmundae (strain CBS 9802 / IAM 14324 / JCM 22182 / KY 12970) TaxID=764103 RepID=G7E1J7_MIXOS|nr:hypothetical protein E5Q_03379 [Mixia osmundae IAM 14324]